MFHRKIAASTAFVPNTARVDPLFATPLVTVAHPDHVRINAELAEAILRHERATGTTRHSNQGGWQSSDDFADWAGFAGHELVGFAIDVANHFTGVYEPDEGLIEPKFEWAYNAWANVNRRGDANTVHAHPGAFWSGVYWVDDGAEDGEEPEGGQLHCIDPRGCAPSLYSPALRMRIEGCLTAGFGKMVTPKSGTFALFPSWMMHAVTRYEGTRPRISVAFNFAPADPDLR